MDVNPYKSPINIETKHFDPVLAAKSVIVFLGLFLLCYIFFPVLVYLQWKYETQVRKVLHVVMLVAWFYELLFWIVILSGKQEQVMEFIQKWLSKM